MDCATHSRLAGTCICAYADARARARTQPCRRTCATAAAEGGLEGGLCHRHRSAPHPSKIEAPFIYTSISAWQAHCGRGQASLRRRVRLRAACGGGGVRGAASSTGHRAGHLLPSPVRVGGLPCTRLPTAERCCGPLSLRVWRALPTLFSRRAGGRALGARRHGQAGEGFARRGEGALPARARRLRGRAARDLCGRRRDARECAHSRIRGRSVADSSFVHQQINRIALSWRVRRDGPGLGRL